MHRLSAIISAAGLTLVASIAAAQNELQTSPAALGPEATGFRVYQRSCAVCHDGGDETAPEVDRLQALGRDRVLRSLGPDGIMALQAAELTDEQRGQVAAFVTASPERRAQLAAGGDAASGDDLAAANFSYPTRRVRHPRDSSRVPRAPAWPAPELGEGPFVFESWEQRNLRAVVVARGLNSPRAIEFLPGGDILVVERAGTLRIVRDGALDPEPVAGVPAVAVLGTATGFMDVTLHPDFASNGFIYLAYHAPTYETLGNNAIFRGRWNGKAIVDGEEIFVSDDVDTLYSRLMFGPDGKLYATIGAPGLGTDDSILRAQHGDDYAGKTLRLNDDGSVPTDNPFVGQAGYNPEIFTLGHRVNLGLAVHPDTGELWVSEHGPNGGDEVNILRSGQNYGWPLQNAGRYYGGEKVAGGAYEEGTTPPHISFVPSIAPGNLIFYTGDKFPAWRRNLFVGALRLGEAPRTGHLLRIVVNDNGGHVRSEMLLFDLHQRIRVVEQGPDGYIWVTTDEGADSVLIRLEPGED